MLVGQGSFSIKSASDARVLLHPFTILVNDLSLTLVLSHLSFGYVLISHSSLSRIIPNQLRTRTHPSLFMLPELEFQPSFPFLPPTEGLSQLSLIEKQCFPPFFLPASSHSFALVGRGLLKQTLRSPLPHLSRPPCRNLEKSEVTVTNSLPTIRNNFIPPAARAFFPTPLRSYAPAQVMLLKISSKLSPTICPVNRIALSALSVTSPPFLFHSSFSTINKP